MAVIENMRKGDKRLHRANVAGGAANIKREDEVVSLQAKVNMPESKNKTLVDKLMDLETNN